MSSWRFGAVYEAAADLRTGTELADRVLLESVAWLDADLLAVGREWVAESPDGAPLTWKGLPDLALAARVRATGHFEGEAGHADARAARRAIRYLLTVYPDLDAIVLLRDRDDQPDRRKGLNQARDDHHGKTVIVVGLAVVEREAWVISGFDPQDAAETARLDAERQALGFNPCERSHELTACKDDAAKRSPKRVLRVLSGDDPQRERDCWAVTALERLRERGGGNGLAAYLGEVRDRLAPLVGHVAKG